jgi:hypothetical protein
VDSFQAFYLSVMSSRNERDTVPFVGTMGLFRRSALTAVGGWNEWCICEDTEASLRVLRDGWSGLYIPRCFGRGVVPPSFKGMLTQRHRWCFGGMQIMRLHWRSLMPWDRSPDNHLTSAQRRDYLMASVGWFRDLLMLAFSLLLLVITGLLATESGFAVSPMDGGRSLLPLSLIIIATICMLWTLRLWTTMSFRRALLSLVISLSVTWVVALGCLEGIARRDAVFLRTSKVAGRRRIRSALRLTRVETTLAVALYVGTGLLLTVHHRPWLLIFIIALQATVYLCGPIASVWNLWAVGVPAPEYQQRFEKRRLRAARRRRSWARLPRPATAGAALTALCAGGVASAFLAPVPLLHTAVTRRAESPQSLLASSASTQVYLKLGSSTSGADRGYYFITSVQLSTASARVGLRFSTSSLTLLGEVLRAAAAGERISQVSLAFRTPGLDGRPTTESVDTFGTTAVASVKEDLSGTPTGTVSLALPALSHVVSTPAQLQRVGPFAGGPVNSPVLLQVGSQPGPGRADAADPTVVQDVFFRIGGATPGRATTSLVVNSSQVILDDIWAWRADHGTGVSWTGNVGDTGVVVNGDHVTAYGLFVEHYEKDETIWNGTDGTDIFFQNEMPYDPPNQAAWMSDRTTDGYPAFLITERAAGFQGYGMGSYSYFNQGVPIFASTAFETASPAGSELHDLLTIFLSTAGSGGIDHVVNGTGRSSTTANPDTAVDVVRYP